MRIAFILTILALSTIATAQIFTISEEFEQIPSVKNKPKKALEKSWLSPLEKWDDEGAKLNKRNIVRLFPDSTVKILTPNPSYPEFYHDLHVVGTVIQIQDPFYELQTDGWLINYRQSWNLDSIRFNYAYTRLQDSVMKNGIKTELIDTVFIQLFNHTQLSFGSVDSFDFAIPSGSSYDVNHNKSLDFIYQDTVLLNARMATDTQKIKTGYRTLNRALIPPYEVQQNIPHPNSTIGLSISYHPMQSYQPGDTFISYIDSIQPTTQLNRFGVIMRTGQKPQKQHYFYNNPFAILKQRRYVADSNDFIAYWPTMNQVTGIRDRFFEIDFFATVDVIGISEIDYLDIKVYPNPAKMGEEIILKLDKNISVSDAGITMTDILGNVISEELVSLGNNTYRVSTDELNNGIYYIVINEGSYTQALKLLVGQ